jgi:hypothetical protein
VKTKNEVWVQFASVALSTGLATAESSPDASGTGFAPFAEYVAQVADAMTAEWEKRQPEEEHYEAPEVPEFKPDGWSTDTVPQAG